MGNVYWPGRDEPIVLNTGPSHHHGSRPRLYSEHRHRSQHPVYVSEDGTLLVPAGSSANRSSSVSAQRPTQVIINNENAGNWEEHFDPERRPRSSHGHRYEEDYYIRRDRSRSRSHVRQRTPSPYYEEFETREKMKELELYKRKEEEHIQKKRAEEHLALKMAKEKAEEIEREEENKKLKEKVIAEYKAKEMEEKLKKADEKKKADEDFKDRMRKTLLSNGYSDDQIERMMKKAEKKEGGGGGGGGGHHHHVEKSLALARPTYIKVHRKHLDVETLEVYQLPWEWDEVSFIHTLFTIHTKDWVVNKCCVFRMIRIISSSSNGFRNTIRIHCSNILKHLGRGSRSRTRLRSYGRNMISYCSYGRRKGRRSRPLPRPLGSLHEPCFSSLPGMKIGLSDVA